MGGLYFYSFLKRNKEVDSGCQRGDNGGLGGEEREKNEVVI